MRTAKAVIWVALVINLAACNNNQGTEPSTVFPTIIDTFSGSLAVQGTVTHRFTVNQAGPVGITLLRTGPTTTVSVGLGVGTISEPNCTLLNTLTTPAGAMPQISGTANAGIYCLSIYDVGNLQGPTEYLIAVAHP
jgi:hypothetical protein